jgi:hypothetical protein
MHVLARPFIHHPITVACRAETKECGPKQKRDAFQRETGACAQASAQKHSYWRCCPGRCCQRTAEAKE